MTNFQWWQALAADHNKFFCCICFGVFELDEAWKDAQGQWWDMCRACAAVEAPVSGKPWGKEISLAEKQGPVVRPEPPVGGDSPRTDSTL